MVASLIGLGSNLGPRRAMLNRAVQAIAAHRDVHRLDCSRYYQTPAIVGRSIPQDDFLNAVARIDTSLAPRSLLGLLLSVENKLGRVRGTVNDLRWSHRLIDLDVLLYDGMCSEAADLILPHPRMAYRRFVLEGAVQVAPRMMHPRIGWTIAELWQHAMHAPAYVAVEGEPSRVEIVRATISRTAGWTLIESATSQVGAEVVANAARVLSLGGGLCLPAVSSFWLPALAARHDLSADGYRDTVYQPKLLVWVSRAGPVAGVASGDSGCAGDLSECILPLSVRAYQGPRLDVAGDDVAWAATELTAAMQNM